MLTPYPSSLPVASVKMIVDRIRGLSDPDVKLADLVHAGWEVSGYAFGQSLGNPGAPVAAFGPEGAHACTPDELCRHLEGCCQKTMQLSVPWSSVAIALAQIVLTWLKNKQS